MVAGPLSRSPTKAMHELKPLVSVFLPAPLRWLSHVALGNSCREEGFPIHTSCVLSRHPFCSLDGKLSAICVDSEPKVVRKLQKHVKGG